MLVLAVVAGLGLAVVVAAIALLYEPRPTSPQEALDAYIVALNDNDAGALQRLVREDVDATAQIEAKLTKFGGQNLEVTDVEINITGFGFVAEVEVTGRGERGPYRESLQFSGDEFGDWYISLGGDRPQPGRDDEVGVEGP